MNNWSVKMSKDSQNLALSSSSRIAEELYLEVAYLILSLNKYQVLFISISIHFLKISDIIRQQSEYSSR